MHSERTSIVEFACSSDYYNLIQKHASKSMTPQLSVSKDELISPCLSVQCLRTLH